MQPVVNLWNSGTTGKIVILGGVVVLLVCGCCALMAAIGSILPPVSPTPTLFVFPSLEVSTTVPQSLATEIPPTLVDPTQAIPPTDFPTATPTDTPTATSTATPTATSTATASSTPTYAGCDCSGDKYNCDDFSGHREAQLCFQFCLDQRKGDIHGLDGDNNGLACEN